MNQVASASLRYPLSVFNKNFTLERREKERTKRTGGKRRRSIKERGGEREKKRKETRKREGDGFRGVEERGYRGGQNLIIITLDRHVYFSVFHHLQKDKQRKQRHSFD